MLGTSNAIIASPAGRKRKIALGFAVLFSVACLVWVLHDLQYGELKHEIATLHWGWVGVGVVTDILVYVIQGFRWSALLKPIANIGPWRSIRAIYVGLFANEVLPLRTGEVIRCYLMARWSELPLSVTLSSALIERIFDGIWLMAFLFLAVNTVELPGHLVAWGTTLGLFILGLSLFLGVAMFHRSKWHQAFTGHRILSKLKVLLDDLHAIGHSRSFIHSFLISLLYMVMQVAPIYALARAYNLELGLLESTVMMVILRLGSVVPQGPGNLGVFNVLVAIGLPLFGVEEALAKRFSLVLWGVITLPLLITGFFALAVTGMRLGELQKHAQATMQKQ